MLNLYLIRHGQTDFNLQGIVQGGGIDAPLNETGRLQGRKFFEMYQSVPFDGLFRTDLQRTWQTIELFQKPEKKLVKMPEFRELNWGILEGKKGTPEIKGEFERITSAWKRGELNVKIEGGESPLEGWERVRSGLDKLKQQFPNGGNVLLCAHGRINRVFLAGITGRGLENMDGFPHSNTGLNLLRINQEGHFFLDKLNDLSHLAS